MCFAKISSLIIIGPFCLMLRVNFLQAPFWANPCLNMLRTLLDTWPPYLLPNHLIQKKYDIDILKYIDYETTKTFGVEFHLQFLLFVWIYCWGLFSTTWFFSWTLFRIYRHSILFQCFVSSSFSQKNCFDVKNINASLLSCGKDHC